MIIKKAIITLTDEETHSPEPIEIRLKVKFGEGSGNIVDYTISIPKGEEG